MFKLLKTNFYRLFKEKTTYIFLAISMGTALIMILTALILNNSINMPGFEALNMYGEALFLSGTALSQNLGILMPLVISIYIGKEFSQNTIRNKIIVGHSKTKVYLSILVVSVAICMILYIAYQLVVFAVGVPVLGWGREFDAAIFSRQFINSLFILLTLSAVINLICMLTRSMLAGILGGIVGVALFSSVFQVLGMLTVDTSAKETVELITKATFLGQSMLIGTETSVGFMLWVIFSNLALTAASAVAGSLIFERLDIK